MLSSGERVQGEAVLVDYLGEWLRGTVLWEYRDTGRPRALVQFETNDPEAPFAITARAGGDEPLVLALGEEEFEMDPGWPDAPSPSA